MVSSFERRTKRLGVLVIASALFALSRGVVAGEPGVTASPLEQGVALQRAGQLVEAAEAFNRARQAAPHDIRGIRGACEVALTREAQDGAISSREPCHAALLYGGQSEDLRNEVASLLAPGRKVTLDDMASTSLLADAALRKDPAEPWGYLARCDVARRIGSADVLAACLAALERVAPDHAVTLSAHAQSAQRVSAWIWLARGVLLVLLFGTAVHAVAHARRRRRDRLGAVAKPLVAGLVALCALGAAAPASASGGVASVGPKGDLSIFKIDDADPESSVPDSLFQAQQPLQFGYFIQDLTARAEAASKRGDHAAAARYYKALAKTAPDIALPARRLCEELQAAGDVTNAVKACRTALTKGGSIVSDFTRFVALVLAQPDPLPAGEKNELDAVLKHLDEQAAGTLGGDLSILHCEVALRFHDTPALEACTRALGSAAPNDAKTVSFQWALAVDHHDRDEALRLIDRAKALGVGDEGVSTMMRATDSMHRRRVTLWSLIAVGAAALALVAVGLSRRQAERRRVAA